LIVALAAAASADDLGGAIGNDYWDVVDTASLHDLMELDGIARFEDNAPLWEYHDDQLQRGVDRALVELGLHDEARKKQLSVALIDMSKAGPPRVASVNGDVMMYAASLPKIAVLLAAFEKIAQGKMTLDADTEYSLTRMIKASSNYYATEMMHQVGKDYARAGLWRRDPLHNLSHGATAMQVARFYYLLATDNLVTPAYCEKMREILQGSELNHKFVRALHEIDPAAEVSRKSGSWSTFHSDSVLVERDGHRYIAVALSNNAKGSEWLGGIITELDSLVVENRTIKTERSLGANQVVR